MEELLDVYDLSKLNHDEVNNLNKSLIDNKIESVI